MVHNKTSADVIRLRDAGRSLNEIVRELGIAKTTAYYWFKQSKRPVLSDEEKQARQKRRVETYSQRAEDRRNRNESKFHSAVKGVALTRATKGQIAEAAVLFRLALHGYKLFGPVFDNDRSDWLVGVDDGFKRVQVKWMRRARRGRPYMSLSCIGDGKLRTYLPDEIDYIVGYDLYTDTAYVYRMSEIKSTAVITARDEAAERWSLLRDA